MRALLLGVVLGAASLLSIEARAAEHQVVIEGMKYRPAQLQIAAGDTVVFRNADPVPHTVTDRGGAFDSGRIESGATWTLSAAPAGEYTYYCTIHPRMTGALTVQ